jgi:hypothetical protein
MNCEEILGRQGSKLKNKPFPLPAGRQALGIKGKKRLIF